MYITVTIRKDEFVASRPWFADLEASDGTKLKGWLQFYTTRRGLIQDIEELEPSAVIQ